MWTANCSTVEVKLFEEFILNVDSQYKVQG